MTATRKNSLNLGWLIRALIVLATIAGLILLATVFQTRNAGQDDPATAGETIKVPDVDAWVVMPCELTENIKLPGTAKAWQEIALASEVNGRIDLVRATDGEVLKKGEPILELNMDISHASHKVNEAKLVLAQKNFDRTKELFEKRVAGADELDRARAELDTAKALVEESSVRLAKGIIRVPADVIVDDVLVEPGEYLMSGGKVARLVVMDPVKVEVDVPEKDVAFVRPGEKVQVTFDPLGAQVYEGTVLHVAYVATPTTKTFPTEIKIANPDYKVRGGMIARVRMTRRHKPEAIAVPLFAVVSREEGMLLFVENDGVVTARKVEFGIFQEDLVEITQGLQAGEKLIVRGQRKLRDGERVTVRNTYRFDRFRSMETMRALLEKAKNSLK